MDWSDPVSGWGYPAWTFRKAINISNPSSALTDYQIPINLTTALYNNFGLAGSWHFTANSTQDSSGYNNHGTQYCGVNCTITENAGGGRAFDGSDDDNIEDVKK